MYTSHRIHCIIYIYMCVCVCVCNMYILHALLPQLKVCRCRRCINNNSNIQRGRINLRSPQFVTYKRIRAVKQSISFLINYNDYYCQKPLLYVYSRVLLAHRCLPPFTMNGGRCKRWLAVIPATRYYLSI
jgi:hypothetical protein